MMELDEADTRWTEESRESFRTAAANLVEAIRQHSAAMLELTGTDADPDAIVELGEHLEAAASAYADAQFEFTGTVPPLGLDEEDEYAYDEDDEDDLDANSEDDLDGDLDGDLDDDLDDDLDGEDEDDLGDAAEEAVEPGLKLTVLHRADFVVTDEPAVIQAGKEAHHEALEDAADTEPPDTEPVDVADLGEALRQLHQSGGVETLTNTPGLASAGATTWILEATELLDERDPDEWPDSPFAPGDEADQRLLHRLDEVAG